MADNVVVTAGTGTTVGADEVVDATLGTVKIQYVKLMDGSIDGTGKAVISAGGMYVNGASGTFPVTGSIGLTGLISLASGTLVGINPSSNFIGLVSVLGNVKQVGSAYANGQVSLATSGTQILGANVSRMRLLITNLTGNPVYIGASGVSTNTGSFLAGATGYPMTIRTTSAISGMSPSGSTLISYWEETV